MATDKRFVVKNGLQTENINFVFNDSVVGSSNITATMLSSNVLSFSGTSGQLFSIADTMTGVIFSVNDISGVPSIEVYDDGRIRMAEIFGNVIIGNSTVSTARTSISTTTGILQVAGGAGIVGNLNVGGTKNLFTGNVGIGTSNVFGSNSNVLTVYGTAMTYGNVMITNTAAGGSGIYFPDGTYQTTAATAGASSSGIAGTVQYSGGSGTFAGDATNFFWDSSNKRLGIGSSAPTNTLTVWGATPAWFNTTNGSNIFEILVGNATTTAATLGYASTPLSPYTYIRNVGGTTAISILNSGNVGIRGVTNPVNTLDVGGSIAVGTGYAGVNTVTPTNSLAVQSRIGIGTTAPLSTLDVRGGAGITSTMNVGDTATVNALVSNVYGLFGQNVTINSTNASTSTTTGALVLGGGLGLAGNINAGGQRSVFVGNLSIQGSNASTTSSTGALIVTNGVGIGGALNVGGQIYTAGVMNAGGAAIVNSLNSNTNVVATNLQSTGQSSLSSLVVNTDTTTSTLNVQNNALVGSLNSNTNVVATNLQSTGLTSVASLNVNAGTYTNTLNVNTTANVNALTSNTGITVSAGGLTVTGLSTFAGNVGITGNLNVTGTINTQNANVLVVNDPIIYLGEGNTSNLWDLGIVANYNDGVYEHTGFVRNRNDGVWTLFDTMTSEPNISTGNINWNDSTLTFAAMKLGNLTVAGNTRSTSSTTGAVVINGPGGLGVGGNINVGGTTNTFTGNVAIGVSSPAQPLHVKGAVRIEEATTTNTIDISALNSSLDGQTTTRTRLGHLIFGSADRFRTSTINLSHRLNLTCNNSAGASAALTFGLDGIQSDIGMLYLRDGGSLNFINGSNSNSDTYTIRATILSGGNFGIATTSPGSILDVNGIASFRSAISVAGTATVNALVSNGAISGTTINGTAVTFTSLQVSGTTTTNALVSNVYGLFGQNVTINSTNASTSTTTGALVLGGGIGLAGNVTAGGNIVVAGTVQAGFLNVGNSIIGTSITSNGTIQSAGTATVNALVSNIFGRFGQNVTVGSTNAAISTSTGALVVSGGIGVAGNVISGGNLVVPLSSSLSFVIASNSIVGSSITSNGIIQSADTATVNALLSNVYGRFGQNVTVGSTNTSVSTTTGALVVSGGIGLAGNINVGGTRSLFTGFVGVGTSTTTGTNANVFSLYGTGMVYGNLVLGNTTAGISGIYFADGTYQTTANQGGSGPGNYSNTNVASYLSGPVVIGNLTISNTTISTSTTTGALLMGGGAGIQGNIYAGGNVVAASFQPTSASIPPNGMFLPAANTLGFATSSTEEMRLTANGNLLLGTTSLPLGGTATMVLRGIGTNGSGIEFSNVNVGGGNIGTGFGNSLVFSTYVGAVGAETYTERMRINTGNVNLSTNLTVNSGTTSLFGGNVGIGTSSSLGATSNVFSVYGTEMLYGNLRLGNTTAGISGIYFADGTYQTTASTGGGGGSNVVATSLYTLTYTGDGVTTAYGTSPYTGPASSASIFINGVYQRKSTYTWVGTTITFSSAPPNFSTIEINIVASLANVTPISSTVRQTYTATTGQTSFTVAGGYAASQLDVYQNGSKLNVGTDVIASDGSTFTLTNPARAGDTLEVVGLYGVFASFPNAYPITGGTLSGNITVGGGAISTSTSTGAIIVGGTGGIGVGGNVNVGGNVVVSGSMQIPSMRIYSLTRTVPTTVNNVVELGSATLSDGGGLFEISVVVPSSGFSVSKYYILPVNFNETAGAWTIAQPTTDGGAYSGNNFDLDVNVNGAVTSLRLRRTLGSTAGTAYITVKQNGLTLTFTESTATSSVTAPTALYNASVIRVVDGTVGIGTTTPGSLLDVNGIASFRSTTSTAGQATVASLVSNANIFGATLNTSGAAQFASLTSNSSVTATTFIPTGGTSPTNGMFLPAANTLGFGTNSVERMRITATGNVVIGTSSSLTTQASLMVSGNTNNAAVPLAALDAATISIKNDSVAGLNLTSKLNFNVASIGASVVSGYYAAFNASNDIGTGLQFGTQTNAAGGTVERMRIDQHGNVSIGTTSVGFAGQGYTVLTINNTTNGGMLYLTNGTQNMWSYVNASGGWIGTVSNHPLIFQTNNTQRMRIDNAGNVGIGTSTITTGYKLQVEGGFAATTKSFVIKHPTKPGQLLRHGSLEGPENGVYVRGRSSENVIRLPDYWTGLVDMDTISVNITPIGSSQSIYVRDIRDNLVYLGSADGHRMEYFYTVFAERKDVGKLLVEE